MHGERSLPPWLTILSSAVFLVLCFAFVFFVARGCVATQEATQVRKYVTGADSSLSDSANVGNEELEPALSDAIEDPSNIDAGTISRSAEATRKGYLDSLRNEEVPPGFEDAHHYLVSSLGIRADATEALAEATGEAGGDGEGFGEALSAAVESYKLGDALVRDYFLPASEEALSESGRRGDQNYLYEFRPFMDYESLGLQTEARDAASSSPSDPNAARGVRLLSVLVAGRPLFPGGEVLLSGSDELVFSVTVVNDGEVAEAGVPVEIVLNTRAERQALPGVVERIELGGTAVVEIRGFKPGELYETAEVGVEVGPVKGEQDEGDNALAGMVTFGI